MSGLVLDIVIEWIFRVAVRFMKAFGSSKWPVRQAKVTRVFCPKVGYGCDKAEILYTYTVEGRKYKGKNVKPFMHGRSAMSYADQFAAGREIAVRVKPGHPSYSVVRDGENRIHRMTL